MRGKDEGRRKKEVPINWCLTTVNNVYQIYGGGTPSTGKPEYWDGNIPWITSADIQDVRTINVRKYITEKGVENSTTTKAPKNSLLVVTRVGLGKIAIIKEDTCFSQDLQALVMSCEFLLPEYTLYLLSYKLQFLKYEGRGTTISGITKKQLKDLEYPLPPLNEQHRIVAKIEELFSELDKGVESLKTAREQLKVYRQALLKHAFEGKLTEQWRKENADKLETADQLMERIKQEREARYQQQLEEWKVAVRQWDADGKVGRKPSKPKKAEEKSLPTDEEISRLPELPDSFIYIFLSALGDLGRGKSKHRPRNAPELFGGKYPFIQTGEVKAANRIVTDYDKTLSEFGLAQSKLWPKGTLCITIAANIAETAFLGFDSCFPDSVVGFTANERIVNPKYIELFIMSARSRIEAYAPATAQKNINLTTLENLVVPFTSTKEQSQVIVYLDHQLSIIHQQIKDIDENLLNCDALRQSILKKAFSGQLMPQDPNDEPASVLLERIAREKAKAASTAKKVKSQK